MAELDEDRYRYRCLPEPPAPTPAAPVRKTRGSCATASGVGGSALWRSSTRFSSPTRGGWRVGVSERKRRRNNCARAAAKRRRSSQFDKENRVPTGDQNDSAEEEFVEKHVSDICQVKLNTEKESAKLCGYSTPRWGTIANENPRSNDSWAFQAVTPERSWEEDQQQTRDENTVKVPTETDYTVIVDRSELKCPALLQCFSNELQQWLCCGSSCPTTRIVSFPAALGAVDLQLRPWM
nr:uncharacterized protein LOC113842916 isoform X2 [Anas platyrhynchos]